MRSIYSAFALCAVVATGLLVARQADTKTPKKISSEEVVKLLEKPQDVVFIDVREPDEIAESGTLRGALTIPVGQLEERLKEVPKDKPVVAFCRRGGRATRASNLLDEKGYKTVGIFGFEEYHDNLKDYIVHPK